MSGPSDNPVVQKLQTLLAGYNFYDGRNQARADDLLVRQGAGSSLTHAAAALRTLEGIFRERYVPPSTRENPYPPADVMAKLKAIGQLRTRIGQIETLIRGMSVPTQDKVWWRYRQELPLLNTLVNLDYGLVQGAQEIDDRISPIGADDWHARDVPAELETLLAEMEQSTRSRQQFLQMATPY
jgi:hypothetical protein